MIKQLLKFSLATAAIFFSGGAGAQTIDTIAFQDFEIVPAAPVWNFSGPVVYNSGFSAVNASPSTSPLGIGGSRAWETTTNSGGLVLDFDNIIVPPSYDSLEFSFRLAAFNLASTGGGPDNLDYVLVAYSTDGGITYTNRMRIRGGITDNSFWGYDATGVAAVYYTPATEALFQPAGSGLQMQAPSTCRIRFDASAITQLSIRITGRSSSSTDTWMIDHVLLTGENQCTETSSSISETVCGSYTSPSGNSYGVSGNYTDTIPNNEGCDSIISISLTVNNATTASIQPVSCGTYTSPSGNSYNISGNYTDTIPNNAGCDSIISIQLTIAVPDPSVTQNGLTLNAADSNAVYQWIDCTTQLPVNGATSQSFTPPVSGSYAAIITDNGCADTSACFTVTLVGIAEILTDFDVFPNPTSGNITIDTKQIGGTIGISLFSAAGQLLSRETRSVEGSLILEMPAAPGIYFLELTAGDGTVRGLKVIRY